MTKDSPLFETAQDQIEKALLKARRVFLAQAVTSESAEDLIRKLWYLDISSPGTMITLVINSPGGHIDSGLAIWDQIKMMTSPVTTLVTGLAASMASVLVLAAAPKRRFATPNARIMIHQPSIHGDFVAPATDIDIQAREILKTRDRLTQLYVEATGQPAEQITLALDRDRWFSAQEARDYGLIDRVVSSTTEAFSA